MQINVIKAEDGVKIIIDGQTKTFEFDTIDELIDAFVVLDEKDFHLECEDETLSNYKSLIDEVYKETKKTDFINAYNSLHKTEITNEEIISAISKEQ